MSRLMTRILSCVLTSLAVALIGLATLVASSRYAQAMMASPICAEADEDEEECPEPEACPSRQVCSFFSFTQPGKPTVYQCQCFPPVSSITTDQ